jgi:hypothetical protein
MSIFEIRVQGHLDQHWSSWFDGLTMSYDEDGTTLLRGNLVDDAALHGVLMKVRDLAIPLLSVNRVSIPTCDKSFEKRGSSRPRSRRRSEQRMEVITTTSLRERKRCHNKKEEK